MLIGYAAKGNYIHYGQFDGYPIYLQDIVITHPSCTITGTSRDRVNVEFPYLGDRLMFYLGESFGTENHHPIVRFETADIVSTDYEIIFYKTPILHYNTDIDYYIWVDSNDRVFLELIDARDKELRESIYSFLESF